MLNTVTKSGNYQKRGHCPRFFLPHRIQYIINVDTTAISRTTDNFLRHRTRQRPSLNDRQPTQVIVSRGQSLSAKQPCALTAWLLCMFLIQIDKLEFIKLARGYQGSHLSQDLSKIRGF
jgi:hypothetical protein